MAEIDTGDTAWMIVSTALVMLMTPGLAFFYGGLVRRKNVLSIMMQCFVLLGVMSIQWVFFGYSLAFGPDHGGFIGDFSWAALIGVGAEPNADYAATIPHTLFMVFQMMFAVLTPALIIGAFAERMKFSAFVLFSVLWATIVYDPEAHWVWGVGGWLRDLGALDFAGGTVVHINAGMAALAAALVLGKRGKRKGYPDTSPPHNLPFAILGAALLWFGWFGFNAGSALGANGLSVSAFVATQLGAAAAAVAWAAVEWIKGRSHCPRHDIWRRRRSGGRDSGRGLRDSAWCAGHRCSRGAGVLPGGGGHEGQARLRRLRVLGHNRDQPGRRGRCLPRQRQAASLAVRRPGGVRRIFLHPLVWAVETGR